MKEIAVTRVRYRYRRIWTLLRRDGFKDNHRRVYRVYHQEGLNLRTKRPLRCRDECLSVNWFLDMENARQKIEAWRREYKELRPHYSLSHMTPMEFIAAQ
jgi:transposase InsO family protein